MRFVQAIILAMAACSASAEALSVRDVLPGEWGWSTANEPCGDGGQKYRFSEDGNQIIVTSKAPISLDGVKQMDAIVYDVISEKPNEMRMKIIGETRMDDGGMPVMWDLRLKGRDAFCWHRTDWHSYGCTANLQRCPVNAQAPN